MKRRGSREESIGKPELLSDEVSTAFRTNANEGVGRETARVQGFPELDLQFDPLRKWKEIRKGPTLVGAPRSSSITEFRGDVETDSRRRRGTPRRDDKTRGISRPAAMGTRLVAARYRPRIALFRFDFSKKARRAYVTARTYRVAVPPASDVPLRLLPPAIVPRWSNFVAIALHAGRHRASPGRDERTDGWPVGERPLQRRLGAIARD